MRVAIEKLYKGLYFLADHATERWIRSLTWISESIARYFDDEG